MLSKQQINIIGLMKEAVNPITPKELILFYEKKFSEDLGNSVYTQLTRLVETNYIKRMDNKTYALTEKFDKLSKEKDDEIL